MHRTVTSQGRGLLKPKSSRHCHSRTLGMLQTGGWGNGSPEWLSAARIFLAASIIFGYFVSAAFFLTSARFMGQDRAMLETVLQTGTLDSVRPTICIRLRSGLPAATCNLTCMHSCCLLLSESF